MNGVTFELEFVLKSALDRVYDYFIDPNLMSLWLCNKVEAEERNYTLFFDADEEIRLQLRQYRYEHFVRYKWINYKDNQHLEFLFTLDEITNELMLTIKDYAESENEVEEEKMFWRKSINQLHTVLGV